MGQNQAGIVASIWHPISFTVGSFANSLDGNPYTALSRGTEHTGQIESARKYSWPYSEFESNQSPLE